MAERTYVIAEAGSSHDGLLERARELVMIAKQVGADAVKFQYWSDPAKLAVQRRAPKLADVYARYAIPPDWLESLSTLARRYEIDFMCTAYLPEDVARVAPYVQHFKVASFEAEFLPLLEAHRLQIGDPGRRVYVSLGMGANMRASMNALDEYPGLRYLHCVSAYPVRLLDLHLSTISALGLHGYSDHSDPLHEFQRWVGALAVMAGAETVEAHLRLSGTTTWNPDYRHSMDPARFQDYVYGIRMAEAALGEPGGGIAAQVDMLAYRSREVADVEEPGEKAAVAGDDVGIAGAGDFSAADLFGGDKG